METIARKRMGFSRIALIIVMITSVLSANANPVGDGIKDIVGEGSDNLTIVYVLGGMFLVCIAIYIVGNYFSKKEEKMRRSTPPPQLRNPQQRVIKKTS